ncbi:MAG: lysine--tRNA ligase [Chloroflexi bacterium]|nr:lysine--tRNA ligase [Chloroflexota bacterium]
MENLNELQRQRLLKLERIRGKGIDPYPPRAARTHTAAEALALLDGAEPEVKPQATVGGRLVAVRVMGKASFAHVQDGSGKLQLLAKALRPPPEKWHGLKDQELRYRYRHLDLIANDEARRVFVLRSRIVSAMRRYLDARGFLEVETPVLQSLYGGANAKPFITHHNALDQDMYLRISDELYLKRLIVGGFERVYEISKDFRNEGIDTTHMPEFTMMECYAAYWDYQDVMRLVEDMLSTIAQETLGTMRIVYQGHEADLTPPWKRTTMREAILDEVDLDIAQFPDLPSLAQEIERLGLKVEQKPSWGKTVEELFGEYVEPKLIQPTFVSEYPLEISPLAKKKPGDARTVERFEAFVAGMESGNAFSELNDPQDQRARFVELGRAKEQGDEETHPLDEDYIQAMEYGMPPTGGLGIGIDRLTMLFANQSAIREVILFPALRGKE